MSFASELKHEICENKSFRGKYQLFQCYGLLMFSAHFSVENISLHTEHLDTAKLFASQLRRLAEIKPALSHKTSIKGGNEVYIVSVETPEERQKVRGLYGLKEDTPVHLCGEYFAHDEERSAFLSGVFLACGNVSDPNKDYHFEFAVGEEYLARELAGLLTECGLEPKLTARKNQWVVYLKDSSQIEDIITMIGATKATLALIDTKMVKELRNNINRVNNCEAANIEKTAAAAINQIRQITYIIEAGEFDSLKPELKELCLLRMENPEMSLQQLGESLSTPLSRSGVNHRLQKLSQIADKLRSEHF